MKSFVSQGMAGEAAVPSGDLFSRGRKTFVRNMASFMEVNQPLGALREDWPTCPGPRRNEAMDT